MKTNARHTQRLSYSPKAAIRRPWAATRRREHPVLSPDSLRQQTWYPQDATDAKQHAFEKRYYDGYAQTYVSAVQAARKQGWRNISVYGWAPYGRTWGGLEKPEVDAGTDHAWNFFGKQIYDAVDIVNNSVYCFYWSPQNVAYTLANIDANMALVNSMPLRKPVRPNSVRHDNRRWVLYRVQTMKWR